MRIDLLGTSFTIETDESPEYLERIVTYYRERIREIESSVSTTDPLKKAILAAILSIDELFTLKERSLPEGEAEEFERIAERLIKTLDETLQEQKQSPQVSAEETAEE